MFDDDANVPERVPLTFDDCCTVLNDGVNVGTVKEVLSVTREVLETCAIALVVDDEN